MIINSFTELGRLTSAATHLENLSVDLSSKNYRDKEAMEIASILASGQCREGLSLLLKNNNIGPVGAQAFATALSSGKCPANLTINLWNNNIGLAGAQAFASAFASGKCPANLKINFWNNEFGPAGAKLILDTLRTRCVPEGLRLEFNQDVHRANITLFNEIADESLRVLKTLTDDAQAYRQSLELCNLYKILESLGEDTNKRQIKLYFIYFEKQLIQFLDKRYIRPMTILRLNDLFEDFNHVLPLLAQDDDGIAAFVTMLGFAMAYGTLQQTQKKHLCILRAIELARTPEDKESCQNLYKNIRSADWNPVTCHGIYFSKHKECILQRRYDRQSKSWGETHIWRLFSNSSDQKSTQDDCIVEYHNHENLPKIGSLAPF